MNRNTAPTKQISIWATFLMASLLVTNTAFAETLTPTVGEQTSPQAITIAGSGAVGELNGPATSASFRQPAGLAVLPDGSVLVADSGNHLIRNIAAGTVSTYAGFTVFRDEKGFPAGMLLDGPLNQSMFHQPQGLAVDQNGNLYVADSANHAIRKITPQGVVTIAGDGVQGAKNGVGKEARLHSPSDVAVAEDGTVYVADTLNHAIRKIAPDGRVTTLNSLSDRTAELASGYLESAGDFRDGKLSEAKFNEPSGIVLDAAGNLYVSDTGNQRIRYIDLKNETVTTVAGGAEPYAKDELYAVGAYTDGEAASARFQFPKGLAMTADGGLLIADSMNHAIRYLHQGKVTTLGSSFSMPVAVKVDGQGKIWVADASAQTIQQLISPSTP